VGYDGDVADVVYVFGQSTHSTMFTRCGLLTLICIASCAAQGGEGRIVGRVMDESCAAVGGALVQLTRDGGGPVLYSAEAASDGSFALQSVKPGVYTARVSSGGFRVRRVHEVVVPERGTLDLRAVALRVRDCDAPGVDCDCFAVSEGDCVDTILRKGHMGITRRCGADLDAGRVVCDSGSNAELVLVPGDGASLYVRPANGAQMTPVDSNGGPYSDRPVRIDGLGPGSDFWVRAANGHLYSHVIITADVDSGSAEVDFWYVNRPKQPRFTPSDAPCRIPSLAR